MNRGYSLFGAHKALSEATKIEEFKEWLEQSQMGKFEDYFCGYRLLVRSIYQGFQDHLHHNRRSLNIKKNLEYERAHAEIADIDSLSADCEASNLIKNLDRIDGDIYRTHNFQTLSQSISTLRREVIKPFDSLFDRIGNFSTTFDEEEISQYLSLFSLVTFCNDTARGYPEGFQIGWIENRFSREDLEKQFDGYRVSLYWLYTKLGSDEADEAVLEESILEAEDWKDLDSSFKSVRQSLLRPFESRVEEDRTTLFWLRDAESTDEIRHLLSDAPDVAVGIRKTLNRIFLWDTVNRAGDVIYGSGSAGFFTILMGVQSIRQRLDTDEPIQVRRLRHPDEPGYNFSYAVYLSGWALSGTGSLHGWAVFVRIATDYSGFGGRQHEVLEEYLERLSSEGTIKIQEVDVQEEVLEDYLSEQGTRTDQQERLSSESKYDDRRLTDILRGGEDIRTEFKSEIDSADKITAEIAALANQEGGVLILGVSDEGEIVGVDNVDKTDNTVSNLITDKLRPPLSADIYSEEVRGKNIVIVEIPDSERPVAFDYRYYGRKGRNKRKLTYFEVKERFG